MLDNSKELINLHQTVIELFKADNENSIVELLRNSELSNKEIDYDNWNGGITTYSLTLVIPVALFVKISDVEQIEIRIKDKFNLLIRQHDHIRLWCIYIVPQSKSKIDWSAISDLYSKDGLIDDLNYLRNIMISVSTGGYMVKEVNEEYQSKYIKVTKALLKLGITHTNTYPDLWLWRGKWTSGEMPQYKDRRNYISKMYDSIIPLLIQDQIETLNISIDLSGWDRIERSVSEIRNRLQQANSEETFQAIGLLCRETIISLAQAIYDSNRHKTSDLVTPSKTDAKRMLDAYISSELSGGSNENLRRYAKSSSDLANELTHKRTATSKDAALCSSATIALVNLIGILENRY